MATQEGDAVDTGQGAESTNEAQGTDPALKALMAKVEALEASAAKDAKTIRKLKDENGERRTAAKTALEEQGQFKTLYEQAGQTIQEMQEQLGGISTKAERWDALEAKAQEKLAAADDMPDYLKVAIGNLDAVSGLDVYTSWKADQSKAQAAKPKGPDVEHGSPTATNGAVDVSVPWEQMTAEQKKEFISGTRKKNVPKTSF